ncbi:MAG TPA: hypothetical protein VFM14_10830 [Gemmatimonadales bacterium]|nr:hypothetical protein [Gemmatimonadales bacterium]
MTASGHDGGPSGRQCLLMGVASALVMGGIAAWSRSGGWFVSDFDQLWIAGRSLLAREDPYAGVLASGNQYPLYYPLPGVLVTLPLALLPLGLARTVLAVCTAFVAGYGLRRLGRWAWLALLAPVWWAAAIQGQIAPALAGAALVPTLGFVLAAKPTIGLALWISRPSLRAAVSVAAILVISVVVWPEWPLAWLRTIQDAPHIRAPVQRPGGVLLLLALLRWRSPEGRLLAAWAIIPRTESLYDMLPLFLLADSAASMGLLVVGTILALLGLSLMPPPSPDLAVRLTANWPVLFGCVYLPALLIVLRPVIEPRLPRLRARAAEPVA